MNRYLFILMMAFSISSCYDKGNDDYHDTNVVLIDELEDSYTCRSFYENLKITPNLTISDENDDLEYYWVMFKDVSVVTSSNSVAVLDTISRERNLDVPINLSSGSYKLYYFVKNKSNHDLTVSVKTVINVTTLFSEGFYILKETSDGNTDMDMENHSNEKFSDLISKSIGTTLDGKPFSFGMYSTYSYLNTDNGQNEIKNFLFPVTTSGDMGMFRIDDMVRVREHKDMFYGVVPTEKPLVFYPQMYYYGYVSTLGHYNNYQVASFGMYSSGYFGVVDPFEDKSYTINPSLALYESVVVMFDETNRRLFAIDYNAGFHAFDDFGKTFKSNGIEDELVYMDGAMVANKNYGYALFNEKNTGAKLLYCLSVEKYSFPNPIDTIIALPASLKINNASMFAVNRHSVNLLYYVVDNKVYSYDAIMGVEQEVVFPGVPSDEEITYVNNLFSTGDSDSNKNFDNLILATYKNGSYKVYMYDIVGGVPYGNAKKTITGEGRVAKIQYVNPYNTNARRTRYSLVY